MRRRPSFVSLLRAGAAGSLLLGAGAAQAQEFGTNPLTGVMQALGLTEEDEKPEINYRERAPLVVPPGGAALALPPPQESASKSNPNWPKDPDVARRKREAEAARRPVVRDDPGRPLLPSELNKGRRKTAGTFDDGKPAGVDDRVLAPSELGFKGWFGAVTGNQEQLTFNGEPERDSLVQPPPGYQTPAPNAPYGVVEKKSETFKLPTLFDRQTAVPQ